MLQTLGLVILILLLHAQKSTPAENTHTSANKTVVSIMYTIFRHNVSYFTMNRVILSVPYLRKYLLYIMLVFKWDIDNVGNYSHAKN